MQTAQPTLAPVSHAQQVRWDAIDRLVELERLWHRYFNSRKESLGFEVVSSKTDIEDLQALIDEKRLTPFRLPLVARFIEETKVKMQSASARVEDLYQANKHVVFSIHCARQARCIHQTRALDRLIHDLLALDSGWEQKGLENNARYKGQCPNAYL